MDRTRLSRLKGSLDVFLAKRKKKSVLFRGFENKKQAKDFQSTVTKAIVKHSDAVITESLLNDALAIVGKADDATNKKVTALLKKAWKPMSKFLSKDKTLSYLVWSGEQGGQAAVDMMGADGTFNLEDSKIIGMLDKRSTFLIDSMDETALDSLRVAITDGLERDLTMSELQSAIHAKFEDEIGPYRAEMITRTEFANAATLVSKETYTQNGVETWTWVQPEGDDDDICTDNDGESVPIGDEFPSGDDRPPAHPNCKCDVIPDLPKDFDASDAWLGD